MKTILPLLTVLMLIPSMVSAHEHVTMPAHNKQASNDFCVQVRGKIKNTFAAPDSCGSPFGVCTTGVSTGWMLKGTTTYAAQGLGGDPIGEASILTPATAEPGSTWSFGGDLVITTLYGDFVARDIGVYDTANGYLSEFARFETGTGIFATATSGVLFIFGEASPDGTQLSSKYRGRVCWSSYYDFYNAAW